MNKWKDVDIWGQFWVYKRYKEGLTLNERYIDQSDTLIEMTEG
jgi:hypothetical protein